LAALWGAATSPTSKSKNWLVISTPLIRIVTNSGVPTTTVTFRVSNVGPRAADFRVAWFECRSRSDRGLLATNRMQGVGLALDSGRSTNLVMNVPAMPLEEYSCCCMVDWCARRAAWREARERVATRVLGGEVEVVNWLGWGRQYEKGIAGNAFAANVDLPDYFRLVYGWTREQWLQELAEMARMRSTSVQTSYGVATIHQPTLEETIARDARDAFVSLCQNSTDSTRKAEPVAPPSAASPHR
jgi:hypothetical protein